MAHRESIHEGGRYKASWSSDECWSEYYLDGLNNWILQRTISGKFGGWPCDLGDFLKAKWKNISSEVL